MENKSTPQAISLAVALRGLGIEVEMEHWGGHKHVDLFLPGSGIQIEVDGSQHVTNPEQILTDLKRSHYSDSDRYGTIHIRNEDIESDLEKITVAIAEASRIQEAQRLGKSGWVDLNERS